MPWDNPGWEPIGGSAATEAFRAAEFRATPAGLRKYSAMAFVWVGKQSRVGSVSTNHSIDSAVGADGGRDSNARGGSRPNTRSEYPLCELCTSKSPTSSGLAVRPVSSTSSLTAASRQDSPVSMKPPGRAISPRNGSMSRRTTTTPGPTVLIGHWKQHHGHRQGVAPGGLAADRAGARPAEPLGPPGAAVGAVVVLHALTLPRGHARGVVASVRTLRYPSTWQVTGRAVPRKGAPS